MADDSCSSCDATKDCIFAYDDYDCRLDYIEDLKELYDEDIQKITRNLKYIIDILEKRNSDLKYSDIYSEVKNVLTHFENDIGDLELYKSRKV